MNAYSIEFLVKRVEGLEQQNRLMKRFGFLALGGIMAALLMGQSQCNKGPLGTNLIEAEKVVLRNAMGSAELTPQSLSFLNSEGRPFVALIAQPFHPEGRQVRTSPIIP